MVRVTKKTTMPRVLAVVAHPDDESFGLGAVILWLHRRFIPIGVLVYTQGEASTLGRTTDQRELRTRRTQELTCAGQILGLSQCDLHSYPDGHLKKVSIKRRVHELEQAEPAGAILAFDETGITGHPDHIAATEAAQAYAIERDISLYLWVLPEEVAHALNHRFHTAFRGRREGEITISKDVGLERDRQWQAIHCHQSQAGGLDVVRARLELLADREFLIEWHRGTHGFNPFITG
jgi:LmbE family N-acetylglucosaminyl deacetylase